MKFISPKNRYIMDRLINSSEYIELKGDTLRRRQHGIRKND